MVYDEFMRIGTEAKMTHFSLLQPPLLNTVKLMLPAAYNSFTVHTGCFIFCHTSGECSLC